MDKLSMYYPSEYVENVFAIDYDRLYRMGIRGLIFDIDNTLVHHGDDATPEIEVLFDRLHRSGFTTLLLTNNDEERVRRFIRNIDTLYVCDADKPAADGYLRALDKLQMDRNMVVCIGDQIFTDILGANRCGIAGILVHFIQLPGEKKIGKKRYLEKLILWCSRHSRRRHSRLDERVKEGTGIMLWKKDTLFCDMNPFFFFLSTEKEILKRHIKNRKNHIAFAKTVQSAKLPELICRHDSVIIKTGKGIDPVTQINKAENIRIACEKINGLILHPGETFSFWNRVGKTSPFRGFKKGRVIKNQKLVTGYGGGLCNLANTIHVAVLHTPLTVTEFHSHSDALAPDKGKRVPFSAGTSVSYNYIDYRVKNNTEQNYQLCTWCQDGNLYVEFHCEHPIDTEYFISEEDHHFEKRGTDYYRVSKIYKNTVDKRSKALLEKKLVLDNQSKVMFDHSLIDPAQIKNMHVDL